MYPLDQPQILFIHKATSPLSLMYLLQSQKIWKYNLDKQAINNSKDGNYLWGWNRSLTYPLDLDK